VSMDNTKCNSMLITAPWLKSPISKETIGERETPYFLLLMWYALFCSAYLGRLSRDFDYFSLARFVACRSVLATCHTRTHIFWFIFKSMSKEQKHLSWSP